MDESAAQPIISLPPDGPPVAASASAASNEPTQGEHASDGGTAPSEQEREPTKAARPRDPMIVYAYDCLRREFEALVAHQPAANTAPSPENVHQMRIATRRLRVALRLFRRMLPKQADKFRKDFGRFARALGEMRDLDVYGDNFRTYTQAVPADRVDELGGYELQLRRERAEARNNLVAAFSDERHAKLLESFASFLDGAPSAAAMRRWKSFRIADGVDKYLKKSLKRVLKLGRKTGEEARAKDLHKLRIRTKRFRYELEFFVAVYPSLAKTAKATKVLQDLLGVHQDACTATERLESYARTLRKRGGGAMPPALASLVDAQEQQARAVRARFAAEWRTFEQAVEHGALGA